jgi:chaperonin cofactor prefoldin
MSQKLTTEEINQLKSLQSDYAKLIAELGQVEVSILVMEKQIEQIKIAQKDPLYIRLGEIQQQESNVASQLTEKYGDGQINLETGEITTS